MMEGGSLRDSQCIGHLCMGTRVTVATDGARVMVWMGEDEREIMVEGKGGMEKGASCATGMISAMEMKNMQVKLCAQCVVLYVSGRSAKFLLRGLYDCIWLFSPIFIQPITAPACTITAVQIPVLGAYSTAPVTINMGCTPVGLATACSPNCLAPLFSSCHSDLCLLSLSLIALAEHLLVVDGCTYPIYFTCITSTVAAAMRMYYTGFLRGRRKRWSRGICAETLPKVEASAQAGAYMWKTVSGGEREAI